jgi:SAM-dependent methyltransferase
MELPVHRVERQTAAGFVICWPAERAWKQANDWWLNIDTLTEPAGPEAGGRRVSSVLGDNFAFSSVDYWDVRRIVRAARLEPADVVYEIGAGLGRVACVFARCGVRQVVAVELNAALAGRIRENAARLRGRRCPVEVRCVDAATASISDGTVFFLFNPFGAETLRSLLGNIQRSLPERPRQVRLIYVNPQAEHLPVFAGATWLADAGRMRTLHGLEVRLFQAGQQMT